MILRSAILPLLLVTTLGCTRGAGVPVTAAVGKGDPRAAAFTTVKPQSKTILKTVEQPGQIEAFEQAPLHVKMAGFVRKVHVDIGDQVRGPVGDQPGQVLAELWAPELEEERNQKQALAEIAQAEITQAEAALLAAEANVKSSQAKVAEVQSGRARATAEASRWQAQFNREQDLVKRRVIEQQTLDETRFQFEASRTSAEEVEAKVRSAQANEDESKARRDKAAADVQVAQSRLLGARAELRRLEALLQYTKITASFDGVVTRRTVDTGHFLQPTSGSKQEAVFTLARMDPVRVHVDVPEVDALQIQKGTPARVRIQALRGQEFHGKVARSAWALDARNRTLRTEIDLPNSDGRLRPGMYAYATITVEYPNVWTLPQAAVVVQGEAAYCFAVENGRLTRTALRLGVRDGQVVEVLKKQIKQDLWADPTGEEVIVSSNLTGLADGQPVK